MKKMQKGFTLIELLVVIAIIGILSAVVLVSLNSARAKSRDARRLSDIRQIMTALELFYNDNSAYPNEATGNVPDPTTPGPTGTTSTQFQDYLAIWPTAPTPPDGTCGAGNNAYVYNGKAADGTTDDTSDPASYTLGFCLGAATGGYAQGARTASPAGIN